MLFSWTALALHTGRRAGHDRRWEIAAQGLIDEPGLDDLEHGKQLKDKHARGATLYCRVFISRASCHAFIQISASLPSESICR